jgi:hypothetical protein
MAALAGKFPPDLPTWDFPHTPPPPPDPDEARAYMLELASRVAETTIGMHEQDGPADDTAH